VSTFSVPGRLEAALVDRGFELDAQIDLRSDPGLGRDYEASTAAYKLYERGAVPGDGELIEDLTGVMRAYEAYLDQSHASELEELIERWRSESDYPTEHDQEQIARRPEVAEWLSDGNLKAAQDDPELFDALEFGKFAHMGYYGGPGSMPEVHAELKTSPESRSRMAGALRWLIRRRASESPAYKERLIAEGRLSALAGFSARPQTRFALLGALSDRFRCEVYEEVLARLPQPRQRPRRLSPPPRRLRQRLERLRGFIQGADRRGRRGRLDSPRARPHARQRHDARPRPADPVDGS
jgi:MrcB-like, N-terminal domain